MASRIRIKITGADGQGVRYLHHRHGEWRLTGTSGTPLALCDVLEDRDEMALIFELDDSRTVEQALTAVKRRLSKLWTASFHG